MRVDVRELLGLVDEGPYRRRAVERVPVGSAEASKRRLRLVGELGTDVAIDLPRGSFLPHGAVLWDDGERIGVVERTPEQALVIRLDERSDPAELVEAAVRIGHAFGNQHVPVEVRGGEILVPITTSAEIAEATVDALDLPGVTTELAAVQLARDAPAPGVVHSHVHSHEEHDPVHGSPDIPTRRR